MNVTTYRLTSGHSDITREPTARVTPGPVATALPGGVQPWQDIRLLFLVLGIASLSALDAAFTLVLVGAGVAYELNPLMQVLIEHDARLFVAVKSVMTCVGLMLLVVATKHRCRLSLRVPMLLKGIFAGYAILVVYEIFLVSGI